MLPCLASAGNMCWTAQIFHHSARLQMTTKILHVLILELHINFREWANFQIHKLQIMDINCNISAHLWSVYNVLGIFLMLTCICLILIITQ